MTREQRGWQLLDMPPILPVQSLGLFLSCNLIGRTLSHWSWVKSLIKPRYLTLELWPQFSVLLHQFCTSWFLSIKWDFNLGLRTGFETNCRLDSISNMIAFHPVAESRSKTPNSKLKKEKKRNAQSQQISETFREDMLLTQSHVATVKIFILSYRIPWASEIFRKHSRDPWLLLLTTGLVNSQNRGAAPGGWGLNLSGHWLAMSRCCIFWEGILVSKRNQRKFAHQQMM